MNNREKTLDLIFKLKQDLDFEKMLSGDGPVSEEQIEVENKIRYLENEDQWGVPQYGRDIDDYEDYYL